MKINNIRIIPYEVHSGKQNMAIDHYFANTNSTIPFAVFRFYGWNPCCISLGYHQDISNINRKNIEKNNIDIVRRPTGGSAVFHCDELTYSAIISKSIINHQQLYSLIHNIIAESLNSLGFAVYLEDSFNKERTDICYNRAAKSEIKYDGKKLVGSAQRIYPGAILQHGSILFSNDQLEMLKYLNYSKNEIEQYKNQLKSKSIALKDISADYSDKSILIDKIVERIKHYFSGIIFYQYLTGYEKTVIRDLQNLFSVE